MEDDEPPAMLPAVLAELRRTARLEGVAIIEIARPDEATVRLIDAGSGVAGPPCPPDLIGDVHRMLRRCPDEPSFAVGPDRRPILVAPWVLRPDRRGGVALWRRAGETAWDQRDTGFARTVTGLIRIILEQGPGVASIDRLTNLPNRPWFLSEVNRHLERLELDGMAGTMLLVDLDGLRRVNLRHGWAVGDQLLVQTAKLLRAMVRPVDMVARVGEDEFAIWLDNMDHMTAAERAVSIADRRFTLPAGSGPRPDGGGQDGGGQDGGGQVGGGQVGGGQVGGGPDGTGRTGSQPDGRQTDGSQPGENLTGGSQPDTIGPDGIGRDGSGRDGTSPQEIHLVDSDPAFDGEDTQVTMSIGIASRLVGDSEDAAELFARAQTALVRSKQSGGGGWAVSHVSRP